MLLLPLHVILCQVELNCFEHKAANDAFETAIDVFITPDFSEMTAVS